MRNYGYDAYLPLFAENGRGRYAPPLEYEASNPTNNLARLKDLLLWIFCFESTIISRKYS